MFHVFHHLKFSTCDMFKQNESLHVPKKGSLLHMHISKKKKRREEEKEEEYTCKMHIVAYGRVYWAKTSATFRPTASSSK